jgi:SAM-dependent methyltransferase
MRLVPRGKILEVGCGSGHLIARLDPARHEAVGLEWAADLAKKAGDRLKEAGIRGQVLATGLPGADLPAETFDLVALVGCLDRCSSPRALLTEASRLLRDGGYAFIEIPCLSSFTARIRGSRWAPLNDPSAEYFFSPRTLQKLATQCGLGAGTIHPTVLGGWPPPGTLLYVARKSSVSLKIPDLAKLVGETGSMTPMGATD